MIFIHLVVFSLFLLPSCDPFSQKQEKESTPMAFTTKTSPAITHFCWGELEVEGHPLFKDAKLWPGGARAWDWDETGTRHSPGIQVADVQELIDKGAKIIILSRGIDKILQVPDNTIQELKNKGVEVYVLQSNEAVEKYNELAREGKPVGALIHSTC